MTSEQVKRVGSAAPFKKGEGAVLPVEGRRNILITSALPYVNNVPHLGNIIGCVLSADVYARYCRLRGHNTLFISGTDEYGTATETKALEEGVSPKEICDKYHAIHREVYEWFDISFDHFGRTTCPQQTTISQDIFTKCHQNGYLAEDSIVQPYCETCSKFLADRFVEGTCPICGYEDARGDQCDSCTKLLDAAELKNPRCKICKGNNIVVKSTKHQFINLPKLQEQLKQYAEASKEKGKWTNNSYSVTEAWIKKLLPRCITRDLKWGVPVPIDSEEYKNKVLYVWFDAPIGYISITADYTDEWAKWWKNPQVELTQFMGKDNIPFHTVLFPASLIAANDNYIKLSSISTTEYLNYESTKFSKSRKQGVFGDDVKTTGVPVEVWRFYLLMNRPENSDSDFNWDDFAARCNNELLANLGNFFNRGLKFLHSNLDGVIKPITLNERDNTLIKDVNAELEKYHKHFEELQLREALRIVLAIGKLGNQYFQEEKPWELIKTNKERCGSVVSLGCNLTKLIAILLEPYLPSVTRILLSQLNSTHEFTPDKFEFTLQEGHKIGEPVPIFKKIEDKDSKGYRNRFKGVQQQSESQTFPVKIATGKVLSVENHPTADSLYVLKVDVGDAKGPKQVVAGLRTAYTPEELANKEVVAVLNLKPAKFQGVASEAMLVVAEVKEGDVATIGLLKSDAPVGTPVLPEKYTLPAKVTALDYRKDFLKLDLGTNDNSEAVFKAGDKVSLLLAGGKAITPDKSIPKAKLR